MPFQRKVFRIEEIASPGRRAVGCRPGSPDRGRIGVSDLRRLKDDTGAIHFALERTKREIAALHATALGGPMPARMTRQLDAVADNAERATRQILDAAEAIEDAARTLSASLEREQECALAHDIKDHVQRIFEACNFQDLSGQRIVKVLAALKFIEERIVHMVDVWGGLETFKDYYAAAAVPERGCMLHGPSLDGDDGHATQADVDAMFARAD